MGGDGGVVATNRKYMRGAGSACHTADHASHQYKSKSELLASSLETMTTCALTKLPLWTTTTSSTSSQSNTNGSNGNGDTKQLMGTAGSSSAAIVACPYGRLYHKEAAIQALLRRKQQLEDGNSSELGNHIRGLKDLYDVRCYVSTKNAGKNATMICPVTDKALNGSIPAILLVPGNPDTANVLSEGAIQQLGGMDFLEAEYGPIQRQVRLAPPLQLLKETIEPQVSKEQDEEEEEKRNKKKNKKDKKNKKKRKHDNNSDDKEDKHETTRQLKPSKTGNGSSTGHSTSTKGTVADAARAAVSSAVQSNDVLSSLFQSKKTTTAKEAKDNLFAR